MDKTRGRRFKGRAGSTIRVLLYVCMVCIGCLSINYFMVYPKLVSRLLQHTLRISDINNQPMCPRYVPDLVGRIDVNLTVPLSFDAIPAVNKSVPTLEVGGRWKPAGCQSRSRLAVVMTYRNRSDNIKLMLQHLHPFLQKQQMEYQMFIVEPPENFIFNRGMLKNIGFMESIRQGNFDCVVFQDIDLMPENDKNSYHCRDMPHHLVIAINTANYKAFYEHAFFGGAVSFRPEHFKLVNGYSNFYFGWGGEDDDLKTRVETTPGLHVERSHELVGRYVEAKHGKDHRAPGILDMYRLRKYRFKVDGLNALQYTVNATQVHPTYTWLHVSYDEAKYIQLQQSAQKEGLAKERQDKLDQSKKKRRPL